MQKHTVVSSGRFYKGVTHELQSPVQRGGQRITYEVGKTFTADGIDHSPAKDCGAGINFCRTAAEALRFGPVVLELSVPERTQIIDTGGKLRAYRVKVESRADLTGVLLTGAKGNEYTTLPAGWKVDESGLIVRSK